VFSAIVVIGLAGDIWPFPALERTGVDLGMRLFAGYSELTGDLAPSRRFLFVDIDPQSCRAFVTPAESQAGACAVDRPAPVQLINAFIQAVQQTAAKVVVLDIAQVDQPNGSGVAPPLRIADDPKGPWFIAAERVRPSADPKNPTLEVGAPAGGERAKRLRFAIFDTVLDPSANDGLIRHYPLTFQVHRASTAPGEIRGAPSGPFLIDLLADDPSGAVADCLFATGPCTPPAEERAHRLSDTLHLKAAARDGARHDAIFYSLPALDPATPGPDGSSPASASPFPGRYDMKLASSLLAPAEPGRPRRFVPLNPFQFDDRIVILGGVTAASNDLHPTPLGVLSGAEIVVNAARTLMDFPSYISAPTEHGVLHWVEIFGEKVSSGCIGALVMLTFWAAIHFVRQRFPSLRSATAAAVVCFFIIGMCVVLISELWNLARELGSAGRTGARVDFLIPMLVVGLEGYTHAAWAFVERIEHFWDRRLRSITNLLAKYITITRTRGVTWKFEPVSSVSSSPDAARLQQPAPARRPATGASNPPADN
jgi:hypothetical protein